MSFARRSTTARSALPPRRSKSMSSSKRRASRSVDPQSSPPRRTIRVIARWKKHLRRQCRSNPTTCKALLICSLTVPPMTLPTLRCPRKAQLTAHPSRKTQTHRRSVHASMQESSWYQPKLMGWKSRTRRLAATMTERGSRHTSQVPLPAMAQAPSNMAALTRPMKSRDRCTRKAQRRSGPGRMIAVTSQSHPKMKLNRTVTRVTMSSSRSLRRRVATRRRSKSKVSNTSKSKCTSKTTNKSKIESKSRLFSTGRARPRRL
mmetsp:Transcript_10390/g.33159  ORF Transcript_10390/g.33159 Transcript_10390/m.33159 type:complete len:261 (-) Transcript_10390:1373-2155(-)